MIFGNGALWTIGISPYALLYSNNGEILLCICFMDGLFVAWFYYVWVWIVVQEYNTRIFDGHSLLSDSLFFVNVSRRHLSFFFHDLSNEFRMSHAMADDTSLIVRYDYILARRYTSWWGCLWYFTWSHINYLNDHETLPPAWSQWADVHPVI